MSFVPIKRIALLLPVLLALVAEGKGIVYIEIDSPQLRLYRLAFPRVVPLGAPEDRTTEALDQLLRRDLEIAHLFEFLPRGELPQKGVFLSPDAVEYRLWQETAAEFLLSVGYESLGSTLVMSFYLYDCVQSRSIGAKRYRSLRTAWREMVHRLVDDVLELLTGRKGLFLSRIAFVRNTPQGLKEIYMAPPDGAEVTPLVKNGSINISPAWSPDGKRLLFTCFRRRNPDLYLLDLPTGKVKVLSSHPGPNAAAAWSPKGDQIALMMRGKGGGTDLFLLPCRGGPPRPLTRTPENETSPAWSPDGKFLAYVSDRTGSPQIYVMDLESRKSKRITFVGNYNCSPAWSPQGDWIAFSGRWEGLFRIFLVRQDGRDLRLISGGRGDHESPSWAPNGRHLVFSSNAHGNYDLWITTVQGGGPWRITFSEADETEPAWSPLLAR